MVEVRQSDICLDDVITSPEVITSIREIITEFNRDKLVPYGLEVSNKIMLCGHLGANHDRNGHSWRIKSGFGICTVG